MMRVTLQGKPVEREKARLVGKLKTAVSEAWKISSKLICETSCEKIVFTNIVLP